jgi:hypothetical protein
MGFLGGTGDAIGTALGDALEGGANALDKLTNSSANQQRSFEKEGFIVPPIPSPSGDGLPSSKIPSQRTHRNRRHIVHWFVPEVGVINMYINPQSIDYNFKKLITPERTKGGYVIQYWGEELPTLNLRGITGSSGVEGLNVLYEVYRAEQLTFDPIGLTIASDSMVSGLGDLINNVGQGIGGGIAGGVASAANGIFGLNPLTQSLMPRNPPTLASLAFGVEMYYNGWVFRGFFTSMSWTESVNNMGMFDYQIQFTVTQRRGYRTNYLPHHHSATNGPSDNSEGGAPLSFGNGASYGR